MSSNTNIGNTPVNQGYVQLIHTGETGGIDGTLRTLYDGDGTASDLQIASNKVKISTELYIGSKTITEYVQDVVGDMFDTNGSHTNITATYDDDGDGAIDLNATGAISGITGGTGIDATGSGNITIAIDSTVTTLTGTQTLTNKTLTAPTLTGTTQGASITLSGDLTVNGTTTTLDTTNLKVTDNLIELNQGVASNANDSGIIIERGSTGDNAIIMWDESADKFTLGTTTATADATGNITITTGTLVASTFEGNLTGDVTGNADTATTLATARNFSLTGDVTAGAVSFDGSGNVALSTTIAADSVALGTDTTGNYVGTITAGSGVSTSGASTGEGIAHNLSINASQTAITSIYNSSLQIGSASDEQRIDFGTSDEIRLGSSTQTSVKIKTDPLGSAQDEVIIGDGTADVDFVVDNTSGTTIFKVDAGTGNTSVTGDLSISGSFNPSTVTTTSVIATNYKHTSSPNNNAFTVGSTSGVEFVTNVGITGGNLTLEKGNGALLQLTTSESDVQVNDALGTINFFASNETGTAAGQLAASILAEARGQFDASNNPTDLIFKLGTTGTATEQFRIYSSGGIKIGNAYTLPPSDGSANQILKTNGSGTLSFADESAGISFNGSTANGLLTYGNSTTADVESNLTFDGSTGLLLLNQDSNAEAFRVTGGGGGNKIASFIRDVGVASPYAETYIHAGGADPQITFRSSANQYFSMGIDLSASSFKISENSSIATADRLTIDTSGNVGIGTDSPETNLHIGSGTQSVAALAGVGIANGASAYSFFSASDGTKQYIAGIDHTLTYSKAGTLSNHDHAIITNNVERIYIKNTGNVGIGTPSPAGNLDVVPDSDGYSRIGRARVGYVGFADYAGFSHIDRANVSQYAMIQQSDGATFINSASGTPIYFRESNATKMILTGGNVGIGVTSPSTKMHIKDASNNVDLRIETDKTDGMAQVQYLNDARQYNVGINNVNAWGVYDATAAETRFTINSSGNVGIATASPLSKIHIEESTNDADALMIRQTAGGSGSVQGKVHIGMNHFNSTNPSVRITAEENSVADYRGNLAFSTRAGTSDVAPTEKMRITHDGKVGIGETNPSFGLQIDGSNFSGDSLKITRGTSAFTILNANNSYGVLGMESNDDLQIRTNGTTRMTIEAGGDVGIGVSPTSRLHVKDATDISMDVQANGQVRVEGNGYALGIALNASGAFIYQNSSSRFIALGNNETEQVRLTTGGALHVVNDVVAFSTTPSDKKLKTNVKDIEYGLDTIMKLKPKQYDWKKDNRKDIGFIAQEVEEVIPEIVKDNEWFDDKIKTLDYEKLTAVLIKAVQEQQKQIEELKNG